MGRRGREGKGRSEHARTRAGPSSFPARRRLVTVLAAAVLGAGAYGLWWIGGPIRHGDARHRHEPINVVVITGDTLGADKLGCYGDRAIATPNLDRMAASGVLFENATTAAPLTLPAHASIFTGTYPTYHGVRDNTGYHLDAAQVTLAETLKAKGYRTGAFIGGFVLDSRWGLNQGFDTYFDDFDLSHVMLVTPDAVKRPGNEVLDHALGWLDSTNHTPFFAWIHLYDPHAPYDPPEPYRSQYGGRPWGMYDGEVAFVDALVGRLFAWLDEQGLRETTVVAFIGDHGESLGRHGENTHGFFVYDATIQVPFILSAPEPKLHGRRVSEQVRSIDLMPTLLDLLGVAIPPPVQGKSVVALAEGREKDPGFVAYSESYNPRYEYGWSELRSLRDGSLHFIAAPRPELYDVRRDPQEQSNLAAQRPGVVRQMERRLEEIEAGGRAPSSEGKGRASVDPEVQRRLAALGYVSAGGSVNVDKTHPLADPKDKIALVNLIKEGGSDLGAGRLDSAQEKISRVLTSDPNILAAYNVLGNVYKQKGEKAKALQAFEGALARDRAYAPALFNLAVIYREMGRLEAATAALRRLLALDARDTDVLLKLGELVFEAGDVQNATSLFERVLAIDPRSTEAERNLGSIALSKGNLEAAEAHFRRVIAIRPDEEDAHYNLGVVYHRRGDRPRAEAEYRREIEAHPDKVKAYHYLGLLYAEAGNIDGQLGAFSVAVRLNPSSAQANLLLADALFQKNNPKEALFYANRAASLKPDSSAFLLLAAIYDKLGNTAEKERALARARSTTSSR